MYLNIKVGLVLFSCVKGKVKIMRYIDNNINAQLSDC